MAKKPDLWMPFYIGDYLADTMHLTTQQHGAYLLLLLAYWRNQGPLRDDDAELASICRLSLSDWSASRTIIARFFEIENNLWVQKRADSELLKAISQKQAKKRGADATNKKRWSHSESLSDSDSESQSVSHNGRSSPSPLSSPDREEKTFVRPEPDLWALEFDQARKAYPGTKRGMGPEYADFVKKHGKVAKDIIPGLRDAVERYKAHLTATDRLKFAKNFKTWIFQSCWTEEYGPLLSPSRIFAGPQLAEFK